MSTGTEIRKITKCVFDQAVCFTIKYPVHTNWVDKETRDLASTARKFSTKP